MSLLRANNASRRAQAGADFGKVAVPEYIFAKAKKLPDGRLDTIRLRFLLALEQARSMMYLAAMMAGEDDAAERAKAMSAVKAQIGRSAKFIGQQAVQMHGGIAMTYEYKVGHLFKRLTMIDAAYGDADVHVRRLAERGSLFA